MKYISKSLFTIFQLFILTLCSFSVLGQGQKDEYVQFLGFQLIGDKNKVVIPFENQNNLIVIPIILNGVLPLNFILDTGVRTAILVDKKVSDVLKLPYTRTITLVGAAGGRGVEAHVAPNISINLPGVMGAGQALLVLEEDYLQLGASLGTNVHGIIGYEIFNRFVVELDYYENTVTLHEPKSYRKKKRYQEIPIKVEDTKPYVSAFIVNKNNKRIKTKLLIDTGASHSLMLHRESDKDIVLPEKTISTSLGRGLGGDITGEVGRIAEINISGHKIENVITSFPEKDLFNEMIIHTKRNGSIGGGIINRFDIVFDYPNEKIYLKKNSDFRRKSHYNMSGIELKADGPKYTKFIVTEVLKDSPADLVDIRVGDEIVLVNGLPKDSLSLNDINNLFKSKAKRKINLRVHRNGEFLKKSFKLKKII